MLKRPRSRLPVSTLSLDLSAAAIDKEKRILAERGVASPRCVSSPPPVNAAGAEYSIALTQAPETDDMPLDLQAVTIVANPESVDLLSGAPIDYFDDALSDAKRLARLLHRGVIASVARQSESCTSSNPSPPVGGSQGGCG